MASMDWGQCPTKFQHSKLPEMARARISVLHDGVDTLFFSPEAKASVTIGDLTLTEDDEVITYVARGMEPYRGFPQFMEMVSRLQKQRPNLHVVVLGNDRVAYGAERKDGKTYKQWALETFDFDMSRLHMPGLQPLDVFRDLMRITSAHVYLTVPFVLSWSLMEAMSTGALIVGSDTAPVREMITDGHNGLLVDFFDVDAQVDKLCHILDNKADYQPLRDQARQTILADYDTRNLLPKYWKLIQSVANGSQMTRV
jgi:glycosyltransferase involved in cell wall biosynthesis